MGKPNITEFPLDRLTVVEPSNCKKGCPPESGCRNVTHGAENITVCYCSITGTPMLDSKCPRDAVSYNATHPPSPIIINAPVNPTTPTLPMIAMGLTAMVSVCLVFSGICFIKRKSLKRFVEIARGHSDPGKQTFAPGRLLPDRFINNPTYDSNTLTELSIPIFSPDDVKILAQIGQGCYGKVFKGDLYGDFIAVKMVKNEHSEEATKEVETMAAFNHPNILHLIGIAKSSEMECPWLLFEFMEHGDLAGVLRNSSNKPYAVAATEEANIEAPQDKKPALTLESLLDISYQIGEGMKYLSSQHFVHRDLAARNCLVSSWGMVKISDFGLSRDVYTCDYYKIGGSRLLPLRWMAPESILYGRFTLESDVWAYGILLWEIYSWGKQPYYGHSNEEVVQLILDGVLLSPPSDSPKLICEIMAGCWKTEPKDRLTFSTIHEKFTKAFKEMNGGKEIEEESLYEIPKTKETVEYMEVI